jgi:hypothetical protein
MTIPAERTRAVLKARKFLTALATAQHDMSVDELRQQARALLRHYPEPIHLRLSAAMASDIWADPDEAQYPWGL